MFALAASCLFAYRIGTPALQGDVFVKFESSQTSQWELYTYESRLRNTPDVSKCMCCIVHGSLEVFAKLKMRM